MPENQKPNSLPDHRAPNSPPPNFYGNPTPLTIGGIRVNHVTKTNHVMILRVPSRPPNLAKIYLVPPVARTINRLLEVPEASSLDGASALDIAGREMADEHSSERFLIPQRAVGVLIKGTFRRAAEIAALEGNTAAAGRLMTLTSNSLRHAFEMHAREYDNGHWMWLLIGAARLVAGSTRQYLKRKELEEDVVESAYRSLAPCWDVVDVRL